MAADEQIRQRIDEGQAMVRSLASKISRKIPLRIDLEDLVAYGQVGLAEAARDFDAQRGSQFTTYAYYRIRGAIYDGVSKMSWTSRARYNRLRYEQLANETLSELNKQPAEAGVPTLDEDASWLRGAAERLAVVYLASGSVDEPGADAAFEDPAPPPPIVAANRELRDKLQELVEKLGPAERSLIRTIYFDGASLQEAAGRLGISKSWASRMHARALEHLATSLRRMGVASPG